MQVKVLKLDDHFKQILAAATGEQLKKAAMAGGYVIEAHAKINANRVFSARARNNLAGSIQTTVEKSTKNAAEVNVGPSVIYGRIQELGGVIKPVFAKMLSWVNEEGVRIFAHEVHLPPRPYLRPALDENEDRIVDAVGYQLSKQINEAGK